MDCKLTFLIPVLVQAVCNIIREQAKPYIEEYGPKFKLESIEFEQLTLGSLPPTFVGKFSSLALFSRMTFLVAWGIWVVGIELSLLAVSAFVKRLGVG